MGIYNFQPMFVGYILNGSKTHTIRSDRQHPDGIGNIMHLYTGLRHPGARLLMRALCVRTEFIRITEDFRVFIGAGLDLDNPDYRGGACRPGGLIELDQAEKDALAWRDGFRCGHGSVPMGGPYFLNHMMPFWKGRLPFEGCIYHWDPKRQAKNWASKSYGRQNPWTT